MIQETSLLSWVELEPVSAQREQEVYFALQELKNATDQEIKRYLGKNDPNYVRPRRNQLVKNGHVVCCGKRVCTVTKKTVFCWEIIKRRW